jgi:hypothetical protein
MHDTKTYSDSTNMLAKSDIIKILEIWIDSMFAMFDGRALQQWQFQWVPSVFLSWQTYPFVHTRLTSYRETSYAVQWIAFPHPVV